VLFRAVRNRPPQPSDFRSYWDLGRRPAAGAGAHAVAQYKGVSMFVSLSQAVASARANQLGPWIAELHIPFGVGGLRVSPPSPSGHVNVWGRSPSALNSDVVAVHPV